MLQNGNKKDATGDIKEDPIILIYEVPIEMTIIPENASLITDNTSSINNKENIIQI